MERERDEVEERGRLVSHCDHQKTPLVSPVCMSEQRRAFTTAVEDVLWKVRRDSSASSTAPCGRAQCVRCRPRDGERETRKEVIALNPRL